MPRPSYVEPMAARTVEQLPEGDAWLYEVKWDGYRALLLKDGASVQIRSRNDKDLTRDFPTLTAGAARLNATTAVVDGEIVAVDANGRPSFQALQNRGAQPGHAIAFYAFDLLHVGGEDLLSRPLDERRAHLPALLRGTGLFVSEALTGTAVQVVEAVSRLGLEGVVAKRRDSRYQSGERSGAWVKLKLDRQQEFVVGGYRPGNLGVDSLLVGVYNEKALTFAGKVRAGMNPPIRRALFAALKPLHAATCPFVDLPVGKPTRWGAGITVEELSELQWVAPRFVVQIRFVEWTADGLLRHAAFVGVRDDKRPGAVRRET
jgi:bifunctional non-homologous end joining protein LigD